MAYLPSNDGKECYNRLELQSDTLLFETLAAAAWNHTCRELAVFSEPLLCKPWTLAKILQFH
jgi:hypothetical protein